MARDNVGSNDLHSAGLHGGRVRLPRSRGAVSGFLLILLGAWGALIPFIGPYFNFGYTPDTSWAWTAARFWLEVLPGAATVVGGLLLFLGANRIVTSLGGWIAAAAGAWFIVAPTLAGVLHLGSIGGPISSSDGARALETLCLFNGLGAVILFLSAGALGRLSIVGIRDVRAAERRAEQERAEQERAEQERAAAEAERVRDSTRPRYVETPPAGPVQTGAPTTTSPSTIGSTATYSTTTGPTGTGASSGSTRIEP